jgi:hypothetical protein
MFARVNLAKAFGVSGLAAVVAFVIFVLVHAYIMRSAYPALTATTTTVVAFITGFATYAVVVSHRAA